MIKHIVMIKLKEKNKAALSVLSDKLLALKEKIDVLLDLEVGVDFLGSERSMDLVLLTSFADKEALQEYRTHSDHIPVLKYIKELGAETKVVDYEC